VVRLTTTLALAGLLFASLSNSQGVKERLPANEFVRQVIDNELQAEQNDHSLWMLLLETRQSGKTEIREVVETKDGDLDWLISVNGRSLAEDQQRERERGLQRLVSDPAELQKSQRERNQDITRSQRLLKMLPDAFVVDYGERRGDFQEMKFKPNPHFRSPSHEAAAFHAMAPADTILPASPRLNGFLESHLIDPVLLRADNFEAFMQDRQKKLLGLIEAATGKAAYAGTVAEEGEDVDFDADTIEADKTVAFA
jgi:hypothetical protein